jgi:hypothetical protein
LNEKTWRDLVRDHFPGTPDKFCDFILWEKTPFPVSTDIQEIEWHILQAKEGAS